MTQGPEPVRLVARAPLSAPSVEQLIWPDPSHGWEAREGVEHLWHLGRWLRGIHDNPDRPAQAPAGDGPVTLLEEVRVLLEERLGGTDGDPIDRLHWTSLHEWAARLAEGGAVAHGRLGLDGVLVESADDGSPALVVPAPGGLATADPSVDVGGVVGDLVELTHRSRGEGRDPAAYQRLLTAFLTGYRGITGGPEPAADLDVYRAAALRVAGRSAARTDPADAGLDLEIAKRLVEHCWALADA
ncbi:hypothetical protein RDV89_08660 [Nocardioides zeae]|uniref:Aminoglycoside phosphotransferase domain-containing protein n=1 Tax=Nocardioides imazamoxiresistens TaxID=3231893 RepID=A0ABU3PV77_9ACTN|nr:hypothetical protein [Nocardioides zeae]MDT9593137.1 hypothetical protein [Nocardioides zeae]